MHKWIRFAVPMALLVVASAAQAQNVVGKYRGSLDLSGIKLPANLGPEQKKMMDQQMAMVRKMVMTLEVKANKTFTSSVTGGPTGSESSAGTWTQSGTKLTMTTLTRGGKPVPEAQKRPQDFAISDKGRTLTLNLPSGPQGSVKLVFKRV